MPGFSFFRRRYHDNPKNGQNQILLNEYSRWNKRISMNRLIWKGVDSAIPQFRGRGRLQPQHHAIIIGPLEAKMHASNCSPGNAGGSSITTSMEHTNECSSHGGNLSYSIFIKLFVPSKPHRNYIAATIYESTRMEQRGLQMGN